MDRSYKDVKFVATTVRGNEQGDDEDNDEVLEETLLKTARKQCSTGVNR